MIILYSKSCCDTLSIHLYIKYVFKLSKIFLAQFIHKPALKINNCITLFSDIICLF